MSGDFNEDKIPDLVVSSVSKRLIYYRGQHSGLESPGDRIALEFLVTALVAGDFDGDERLDVIAAGGPEIRFVPGGEGGLTKDRDSQQSLDIEEECTDGRVAGLTSGDFNGDGRPDLAVAVAEGDVSGKLLFIPGTREGGKLRVEDCQECNVADPAFLARGSFDAAPVFDDLVVGGEGGSVALFRGSATGLVRVEDIPVGPDSLVGLSVADLDGDGFDDVIVVKRQALLFLWGGRRGGLEAGGETRLGDRLAAAASADFDHDGFPDVVVANERTGRFTLLSGGRHGFVETGTFAAGSGPVALSIGDYNGDGRSDVCVLGRDSDTVVYSLGGGGGLFRKADVSTGGNALMTSGDYDGDRFPEVVVAGDISMGVRTVTHLQGGAGGLTVVRTRTIDLGDEGNRTSVLLSGCFDCDAYPDVLLADYSNDRLLLVLGGPDGLSGAKERIIEFSSGELPPSPDPGDGGGKLLLEGPISMAAGDFDGDGALDVVVGTSNTNTKPPGITLLRRRCPKQGSSWASSFTPRAPEARPVLLLSGDYDRDGVDDLVVVTRESLGDYCDSAASVTCLLGSDNGFQETAHVDVGREPVAVTGGDYDGDGFLDVAVAAGNSSKVFLVFGGTGGLSQEPPLQLEISDVPVALSSGDHDGDGFVDLVVASQPADPVPDPACAVRESEIPGKVIYFRGGAELQRQLKEPPVGVLPGALISGDFDGDGFLDVVALNEGSDDLTFLRGGVDGLSRGASIPVGEAPVAAVTGDFDGDGFPDVAVSNRDSANVTFLRQRFLTPHPSVYVDPRSTVVAGSLEGTRRRDHTAPGSLATPMTGLPSVVYREHLLDPRFPPEYSLDLSPTALREARQVAVLPTPVFRLEVDEPRRFPIVTNAVRVLPEEETLRRDAMLTLRLRDHDQELLSEATGNPEYLRVFRRGRDVERGVLLAVPQETVQVVEFFNGMGVAFPIPSFGSYVVALERE